MSTNEASTTNFDSVGGELTMTEDLVQKENKTLDEKRLKKERKEKKKKRKGKKEKEKDKKKKSKESSKKIKRKKKRRKDSDGHSRENTHCVDRKNEVKKSKKKSKIKTKRKRSGTKVSKDKKNPTSMDRSEHDATETTASIGSLNSQSMWWNISTESSPTSSFYKKNCYGDYLDSEDEEVIEEYSEDCTEDFTEETIEEYIEEYVDDTTEGSTQHTRFSDTSEYSTEDTTPCNTHHTRFSETSVSYMEKIDEGVEYSGDDTIEEITHHTQFSEASASFMKKTDEGTEHSKHAQLMWWDFVEESFGESSESVSIPTFEFFDEESCILLSEDDSDYDCDESTEKGSYFEFDCEDFHRKDEDDTESRSIHSDSFRPFAKSTDNDEDHKESSIHSELVSCRPPSQTSQGIHSSCNSLEPTSCRPPSQTSQGVYSSCNSLEPSGCRPPSQTDQGIHSSSKTLEQNGKEQPGSDENRKENSVHSEPVGNFRRHLAGFRILSVRSIATEGKYQQMDSSCHSGEHNNSESLDGIKMVRRAGLFGRRN